MTKHEQELADLKETVKALTESEERIQQMNQQVCDILGKYSDKTGSLLRSQETVEKLDPFLTKKPYELTWKDFYGWVKDKDKKVSREKTNWHYWFSQFKYKLDSLSINSTIMPSIKELESIIDKTSKEIKDYPLYKDLIEYYETWVDEYGKTETEFFKNQIQTLTTKNEEGKKETQELQKKLETTTNEAKEWQNQLVTKEQDLQKLQTKLEKTKQVAQENINLAKQKVSDLEDQLINLAKQKLKGKKAAERVLKDLETNLKDKEQAWNQTEQDYQNQITTKQKDLDQLETVRQQEQTELESELNTQTELVKKTQNRVENLTEDKNQLQTELTLYQQKIKALETQLVSLSTQKITTQQTLTRTHQQLTQTQTHYTKRKHQALLIGIIGLTLIIYLASSTIKNEDEELKEPPRTWS